MKQMNIIQECGFKVSGIGELSYPGSCGQCEMKNRGIDTIVVNLTPDLVLKFCNVCFEKDKEKLDNCVKRIEKEQLHFDQSLCIPDGLFYDRGWRLCEDYKIYFEHNGKTLVPMMKDDHIRWVKKDDLLFLNF